LCIRFTKLLENNFSFTRLIFLGGVFSYILINTFPLGDVFILGVILNSRKYVIIMLYSLWYQLYINSISHFLYIEHLTANMAAGVVNRDVVDINGLNTMLKILI
jgi:hypothetical protein